MIRQQTDRISRRAALALAAAERSTAVHSQERAASHTALPAGQLQISPAGPTADLYGENDHYPVPGFIEARLHGNPFTPHYRVGAFSHADEVYVTRRISRADAPWSFHHRCETLSYRHAGQPSSVEDYLARNPVTGLLIALDDTILCERYQYGRTDRDRLLGQQ